MRGDIARLRNGKSDQANATERLTGAVEALAKLVTEYHTEVVKELIEARASTRSAHYRINWLYGIVAVLSAAAIVAAVLGA